MDKDSKPHVRVSPGVAVQVPGGCQLEPYSKGPVMSDDHLRGREGSLMQAETSVEMPSGGGSNRLSANE